MVATVTLTFLEVPIPLETFINVQLSLIQSVDDGAVIPITALTVLSTMPKFEPSTVTEKEPSTDPERGKVDETTGAKYENN